METKLNIKDVISNMLDELARAYELLVSNEEAEDSMLLSDIESSLDRASCIMERIEFALLVANYAGVENASRGFKYECDNAIWRDKILKRRKRGRS